MNDNNDAMLGFFYLLATFALIGGVMLLTSCAPDLSTSSVNINYEHGKHLGKTVSVTGTCLLPDNSATVMIK